MNIYRDEYSLLTGLRIPPRRNIFISYYHADQMAVNDFVQRFSVREKIFTPFMLAQGQSFGDDIVNSSDPNYVMQQIRRRYFGQSTITIVLVGNCTHSRRYVDWEIKASLQKGGVGGQLPHGLMAIDLSKVRGNKFLPQRLLSNYKVDHSGYAPFYYYPQSGQELREWIEIAYNSRTSKSDLIMNPNDMMSYNQVCKVCGVTH